MSENSWKYDPRGSGIDTPAEHWQDLKNQVRALGKWIKGRLASVFRHAARQLPADCTKRLHFNPRHAQAAGFNHTAKTGGP